jgi:hypothetical protein
VQLDKAVTAPGVFAPARTYSVVRDDAGLYLIYTGRAMSLVPPRAGGIAGMVLDRVASKRLAEIELVEAELRRDGVQALKDRKHCRFFPRDQIQRVEVRAGGWPVAVIHADKKIKLHFQGHDVAVVHTLFAPFAG